MQKNQVYSKQGNDWSIEPIREFKCSFKFAQYNTTMCLALWSSLIWLQFLQEIINIALRFWSLVIGIDYYYYLSVSFVEVF